jgi:DNA-binding NarL/FixJ family response regulator
MPREAVPGRHDEVVVAADGDADPVTRTILRAVRYLGGAARVVSRLDASTAGGRVVIVAGRDVVAGTTAASAAGASAVVAVAGTGAPVAGLLSAGALVVIPAAGVDRELPAGLEAARAGALYVAPDCAGALRSALDIGAVEALTPRELETLRWVALGHTHREIAEQMRIAETTVNTYLKRLRSKLDVTNKAELTRVAMRLGLI